MDATILAERFDGSEVMDTGSVLVGLLVSPGSRLFIHERRLVAVS